MRQMDRATASSLLIPRARVSLKKKVYPSHPKRYLIKNHVPNVSNAPRRAGHSPTLSCKRSRTRRYFQPANESRIPSRKHVSPRLDEAVARKKKSAKHASEEHKIGWSDRRHRASGVLLSLSFLARVPAKNAHTKLLDGARDATRRRRFDFRLARVGVRPVFEIHDRLPRSLLKGHNDDDDDENDDDSVVRDEKEGTPTTRWKRERTLDTTRFRRQKCATYFFVFFFIFFGSHLIWSFVLARIVAQEFL